MMKFGLQGTVIGWQDPWAGDASDRVMRTGTGSIYPSQDPTPTPEAFLDYLKQLRTDIYVHHVFPGLEGQAELLADVRKHGIELCLGNEYGNINGPWVSGTNRYDLPDEAILAAADQGVLCGLLYDEPEHLQINAAQYRKDGWHPHWGAASESAAAVPTDQLETGMVRAVSDRVRHVDTLLGEQRRVPLVAEHVFPVMFHAHARGGMALCPKIMKESFQPLQLATALGAARQYGVPLWICADLWGPDVGAWPIRTPGFPGHSPAEFASALRMGYYMGPTHLFTENIDALARFDGERFRSTVFGDIWEAFVREYVPAHPIDWTHADAVADIVLIHGDDSNYGQQERPFGHRATPMPQTSQSVFAAWHLLSHGSIPAHGSCLHIPGYSFPRHELKRQVPGDRFPLMEGMTLAEPPAVHPLFQPLRSTLVLDGYAREEQLGAPQLIVVAGSFVSPDTLRAVRKRAEAGARVLIAEGLAPEPWQTAARFDGGGVWLPTADLLGDAARELAEPLIGSADCWTQRFRDREVRIYPQDSDGYELAFEIVRG